MANESNQDSIVSHLNADTDSSITAIHHTLGPGEYQASPGSHRHDGTDSHRTKFEDIDGGWMNIDGGMANSVFGGLPQFDGGSA